MLAVGMRLCVAVACVGLCGAGQEGRLAIEYGDWQQGQCRNATATGSRGRTELPQVAPGVRQAQECQYCRSVRQCSARDAMRRPVQCLTRQECRSSTTPPGNDRRSIG